MWFLLILSTLLRHCRERREGGWREGRREGGGWREGRSKRGRMGRMEGGREGGKRRGREGGMGEGVREMGRYRNEE